jgi:hypothetical protein
MNQLTTACVSMMTVCSAIACGGTGPAGTTGGTAPADSPGAAATVSSVSIRGFTHASDGTVLAGVQVCLGGSDPTACATSGADGSFALAGAPANDAVTLTFDKAGFLPEVRAIGTQTSDITFAEGENVLYPAAAPQTFMGVQTDPTKGHIEFFVLPAGSEAAPAMSVTLAGPDASPQPIYLSAGAAGGDDATAGTQGAFVNLTPGLYVVRFANGAAKCAANDLYGFPETLYQDPSSGQTAVVVPVYAGSVTAPVAALCSP